MTAVRGFQERVTGALAALLDPRLGRVATAAAPPTYEAYLEYLAGVDLLQQSYLAFPHLYRSARLDSTFSLALIWGAFALNRCQNAIGRGIVEADSCAGVSFDSLMGVLEGRRSRLTRLERHATDFVHAWRDRDERRYYESARAAADLVPLSFWTTHAILGAMDHGRVDEALERGLALRNVEVFDRVWPDYRVWLANLLHDLGRHQEELAEAERWTRTSPWPSRGLWLRSRAFVGLGHVDSALASGEPLMATPFQVVALAQELRHHGHRVASDSVISRCTAWARSEPASQVIPAYWQAECFRLAGAGTTADSILATLHDAPPPFQQPFLYLSLGLRAAERGDSAEARRWIQVLEEQPEPSPPAVRFASEFLSSKAEFQARIAAALGDRTTAVRFLQRSLQLRPIRRVQFHFRGYPEFDHLVDYPPFHRATAWRGREE